MSKRPSTARDYVLMYGVPKDGTKLPLFEPTQTIPGSLQKVQALVDRIDSGLPLWHPEDRTKPFDPLEDPPMEYYSE